MNTEPSTPVRRWRLRRGGGAGARATKRYEARTRRRKLRAAAPYLVVLTVVLLVAGAVWAVFGTALLGVRTVEVEGEHTVSSDQVVSAAAIRPDTPLARVDTAAAARGVRRLAPIADVHIVRSWPHTVVLRVTERKPVVAAALRSGGYTLLDAGGVPFRQTEARPDLPVVVVANPGPHDRATRAVIAVAESLTTPLREKLDRIIAPTPEQVELRLVGGRSIFWGDADDGARKATVATALLGRPGKRIDVSAPGVATIR